MAVLRGTTRSRLPSFVKSIITPIIELFQTWGLLSFTYSSKPERQATIITTGTMPLSIAIKSEPEQPRQDVFVSFNCTYFIR